MLLILLFLVFNDISDASTTLTVAGLEPYINYTVTVAAMTVAVGPVSDPVSVQTLASTPTQAPTISSV